jgi:hypothetical protein
MADHNAAGGNSRRIQFAPAVAAHDAHRARYHRLTAKKQETVS